MSAKGCRLLTAQELVDSTQQNGTWAEGSAGSPVTVTSLDDNVHFSVYLSLIHI